MSVAITGIGCETPIGDDFSVVWQNLLAGTSGISSVDVVDVRDLKVHIGAQVPEVARDGIDPGKAPRAHRFALHAIRMAMREAQLEELPRRVAIVAGHHGTTREEAFVLDNPDLDLSPKGLGDFLGGHLGSPDVFVHTVTTACSSGAFALGMASELIRSGRADCVIAGGTDAVLSRGTLHSFYQMGALSDSNDAPSEALRPFDRGRNGFVIGEGACFMVIESEETAATRGVRPRARLLGWGARTSTDSIAASCADGGVQAGAMADALALAGIDAADVGYVNAHGSGTVDNDAAESKAIGRLLGHAPFVSSTKGSTGHMIGAAGAIEAAICVRALETGVLPFTKNLDKPDPLCDLRHVLGAPVEAPITHAVSNSFGLAGSNAAVVLGAA